ncbi:MAG: glycosyltransferase [Microcoleus sp. PH2017_01_SCD_O_A]|uniref:glycosyltransferase n=1 Tax=unclassified Microcoleus TaxID=2642155 RepID=UPI001E130515|nr:MULTISPECIES: glycosyltransferase [unclassified Microcoleus]TAF85972.1 MAG: glycosyltransferase [Oscillatoriales cyanobacterium]MCC3426402.1 glycosyltransferase [Microcoleus sp. PH2017_01_SCD_O_A]MCC3450983.1 glycosyltransferase [Microcoleus sp. PH2017_09_SFU_O_A]MCC3631840.1 glycosyltransferase [Microcoleus sp. PH2017_39_LGB_O_B]MCC3644004.1 glycosyltransferase [Microcoleus sp. PH2017_33_LGB_O_A]
MTTLPICSFIIVNYNGLRHTKDCLKSLQKLAYPESQLDLIVIDNCSQDDSVHALRELFPKVRIFVNTANNFAKALNLGISEAKGQYIGFLNNDATLDSHWLEILVKRLETDNKVGAASGKLLFKDGRINSAGIQQLPNFYWQDVGFGEKDSGQYNTEREVEGLCWAAVLFRRECLEDVGPIDEDFVMYFEDVEFSKRCQKRDWKMLYTPAAIAHHEYRGSSKGSKLTEYFCNRNRFLYLAKHEPLQLVKSIHTSDFFSNKQYDLLFESLFFAIKKLLDYQKPEIVAAVLPQLTEKLAVIYSRMKVDRILPRLEVVRGDRKMSIAIYDHGLHFIGGGQKYVATIASLLQNEFEITFIANKPVAVSDLESWYGINLSGCKIKIIPLQFYEKRGMQCIDSSIIAEDMENPFDEIARESKNYDIFVNANQLEKVKPLSPISVFFCHFPNTFRNRHFAVDDYTFIIANSQFTVKWLEKRWNLQPTFMLYPPVEMATAKVSKEKIILAVGQFEAGGTKKQIELIQAFRSLLADYPDELQGWRLILAGSSVPKNPYLKTVQNLLKQDSRAIELKVNGSLDEVKSLYAKSSIFWHGCGLGEVNPQRFEHFGMATVEAMQNCCAPIAFCGGGQPEIVEHGRSGFLFNTVEELCRYSHQLIVNPDLLAELQAGAQQRSQNFRLAPFEHKVKSFFEIIHQEYATIRLPNPGEIAQMLDRP